MAAAIPNCYRHNAFYAAGVPRGMYRSYNMDLYTGIVHQFPNDPVGFRRLVKRDFTDAGDIPICVEHTVCRVAAEGLLSDWSFDTTIFRTGTVPPVRWNENNVEPPFRVNENIAYNPLTQGSALFLQQALLNRREEDIAEDAMHLSQDALSRQA